MNKFRRLTELKVGDTGRVVSLLTTKDNTNLRKLMAFGVIPGAEIQVLQIFPAYVLQLGYTELALDQSIAETILVTTASGRR